MNSFENLLPYCTVRLVGLINNQPVSVGTGFYYFFNDSFTDENGKYDENGTARPAIVTNKHVLKGMEELLFYFSYSSTEQDGYKSEIFRTSINENTVINHPEENIDLCIILIDEIFQDIKIKNRKLHLYPIRKDIRVDEETLKSMLTFQNLAMIGYPEGIWDSVNNLPVFRKGVNATPMYENYQGEEEFAVDIAMYKGSSGSPVFIHDSGSYIENGEVKFGNRLLFVGIMRAAHLYNNLVSLTDTDSLKTEEMLHIGIAIKASKLDVFEDLIKVHYEE